MVGLLANLLGNNEQGQQSRGLLGNINKPLMDLSIGLLANSGFDTKPKTFGEVLGGAAQFASQRADSRLRRGLFRDTILQSQKRREGRQALRARVAAGEFGDPDQNLAVFDADPEGFAKGVLGTMFNERGLSGDAQMMQLLGIPFTPEGFAQFQKVKATGQGGGLDDMKTRLEIEKLMQDLQSKGEQFKLDKQKISGGFQRTTGIVLRMSQLSRRLTELGPIEQGLPAEAQRFVQLARQGKMTIDDLVDAPIDERTRAILNTQLQLQSLIDEFLVENIKSFSGEATRSTQQALERAKPNVFDTPQQRSEKLALALQTILSGLETFGVEGVDKQAIEDELQAQFRLRDSARFGSGAAPAAQAPAQSDEDTQQRLDAMEKALDEALKSLGAQP